jgi:hypothetical protein
MFTSRCIDGSPVIWFFSSIKMCIEDRMNYVKIYLEISRELSEAEREV